MKFHGIRGFVILLLLFDSVVSNIVDRATIVIVLTTTNNNAPHSANMPSSHLVCITVKSLSIESRPSF